MLNFELRISFKYLKPTVRNQFLRDYFLKIKLKNAVLKLLKI